MGLTLRLTAEQAQRALVFLGEAPYKDVADIIDAIKSQANEQLAADH